jgi:hypothetical protein
MSFISYLACVIGTKTDLNILNLRAGIPMKCRICLPRPVAKANAKSLGFQILSLCSAINNNLSFEFVREELCNFAAGYDGGEDNMELGWVVIEQLPHLWVTHQVLARIQRQPKKL